MALDLIGIDNRGEFYSHHYLDALLESDLKPLLQRWAERENDKGGRAPWKQLNGLASAFHDARAQASEARRAPDERLRAARPLHARLLEALGYSRQATVVELEDGLSLPLVHEERRGGRPTLWVIEAGFPEADEDALDQPVLATQLPSDTERPHLSWRELLDRHIFRQEEAPTWVIFLGGREVVLGHRHKWSRGKALAFDLDELFARRQATAWKAMAALLHRDALVPDDGISLHESLDEASHKHAFGVSTDLRQGAEQAIEILGNEAAWYFREVERKGVFGGRLDPAQLTRDCLVFLYRLIFLFYVEARSEELGVAPMKAESYRRGYSLESLRDLELVPLTSPQAQDGSYLHESLKRLFALVDQGYPQTAQVALGEGSAGDGAGFRMRGLHSRLFDDEGMPLLRRVTLRNRAVQQVLALLSLSREGQHRERGRISYASLGINQLGAVYEGLLSYTGFFAQEDLIEVVNAKERDKPEARTFFVPARLRDRYDDNEVVRHTDEVRRGQRRVHPKGTYLYRLAGRDREKSASYYTPEVLTRCLVRYTLKERLGDGDDAIGADEILDLSVCEPAMGSGAFLNETVNQLAEAYLERKQHQLGRRIDPERYPHELQRVRAHIAARNCYGVDLNPLATELGKVSLWLNVLRPGARAPFFDPRIRAGNSLVGARRAWYPESRLHKSSKNTDDNWLDVAPQTGPRPQDGVWQFLLPASGMADFAGDKVVAGLVPDAVARVKAWQKGLNRAWSATDQATLRRLSKRVEDLWQEHEAARKAALSECTPTASVWPEPDRPDADDRDEAELARAWARAEAANSAGRRLKRLLDLWCALWFWPLMEAERLPSRAEWLAEVDLVLSGRPPVEGSPSVQRLRVAREVAEQHRFVHWEWAFPEVFAKGGFDVVVGNPPWLKLQWNEGGVLADLDPRLVIRRLSAKQTADLRTQTLVGEDELATYLAEFQELTGQKAFLNGVGNYALLRGVQTNLYKAFMVLGLRVAPTGAFGLIHQKGVYDDPKGGALRAAFVARLRWHLHFINKLLLFESIEDQKHYEFSVFGAARDTVRFNNVSNLFHPRTLLASEDHDGLGEVPAIKTPEGNWDLRGHRSRIVPVNEETLALFARLYDSEGTPAREARLPVVHSADIVAVLRKFAGFSRLGAAGLYYGTEHFHESNSQQRGYLRRRTSTCRSPADLVLSGPHFYVGDPARKTPNLHCRHNQDYTCVDLATAAADFLPLTNFEVLPAGHEAHPIVPWSGKNTTTEFRHVNRMMGPPTGERTLASALVPPGPSHIHGVYSVVFGTSELLIRFAAVACSIPADFFVKTTGKTNLVDTVLAALPVPTSTPAAACRTLLLNCLTTHYAPLWSELFTPDFTLDSFTKPDPRLPARHWQDLGPEWTWHTPLRTPFSRRQALVELDALAALALGLTDDELCLIYRVQFPVLQQYEADTWYDRRGRIVFTNNRGLNGVGIPNRKDWESIKEAQSQADLPDADWTSDALGRYEPPFDRCDREQDMRQAYAEFLRRGISPPETG